MMESDLWIRYFGQNEHLCNLDEAFEQKIILY